MTSIVKLQKKGQFTIPNRMRDTIGLTEGDYVQVVMEGNKIILEAVQASTQTVSEELTPAQRRLLDARLAVGLADVEAGRVHGPFTTHAEMAKFLVEETAKAKDKGKSKSKSR